MNEFFRKMHLFSALSLLGFMLIYFISGFEVLNHRLFPSREPAKSTRTVQVQVPASLDNDQTGRWLAGSLNLGGKPESPRVQTDGRVSYRYNRPGITLTALLAADRRSVEIIRTEWNLSGTVGGYHFVHSYGGGWLWDLWALLLDLTSVGCVVFAVSGVCIWATQREQDCLSWVMLASGLLITASSILYLMLTR